MAHKIEIKLESFSEDEHHKVRNFVEAVWTEIWKRGWAEMQNFDGRVNPGARFEFTFPARDSHEANVLIERLVRDHSMGLFTTVTHTKKARRDG